MEAIQPFLGWLHEHLLSIVFVVSLIDATGLPFPGRAMLVAAGMATAGPRDVVLLIATSVTGSLVGDHILYALGMRRGTRLLALYCRLSLGSVRCVEKTLTFFRRYGAVAILVCRFSTGVRLFAAVLAGSGEIRRDQLSPIPQPRRDRLHRLHHPLDHSRSHRWRHRPRTRRRTRPLLAPPGTGGPHRRPRLPVLPALAVWLRIARPDQIHRVISIPSQNFPRLLFPLSSRPPRK